MDKLTPDLKNISKFLERGYTCRDVFFRGVSLKILSKIFTLLRYDFYHRGSTVDIDYRSVIEGSKFISIHDRIWIQKDARLMVPLFGMNVIEKRPYLIVGEGSQIGPNCTISAANRIVIGKNVLFGINVLVIDHAHDYGDITRPIKEQGLIRNGEVFIEDNVWIGSNAVICTSKDKITIGENSIIGANAVVRGNVDAYCLFAGNPAVKIKSLLQDGS